MRIDADFSFMGMNVVLDDSFRNGEVALENEAGDTLSIISPEGEVTVFTGRPAIQE